MAVQAPEQMDRLRRNQRNAMRKPWILACFWLFLLQKTRSMITLPLSLVSAYLVHCMVLAVFFRPSELVHFEDPGWGLLAAADFCPIGPME